MVRRIDESVGTLQYIQEIVDSAEDLMRLNNGIGFQQISGIDVISNVSSALKYIEQTYEYLNGCDEEERASVATRYKAVIQEYINNTHIALTNLTKKCNDLVEGCKMISSIMNSVQSECDDLK